MISHPVARELQNSGLRWRPETGDAFAIDREGFDGEVFVVSDMTIQSLEFETGTILGFNGTTEWALDSIAVEHTLWLPHEHQLRRLLGSTFRSLSLVDGSFRVDSVVNGIGASFTAVDAADAYAAALLNLVRAAV